jgi:hypothetical protein
MSLGIEIKDLANTPAQKGDRLLLIYNIVSVFEESQKNALVDKINQDGRLRVVGAIIEKASDTVLTDRVHITVDVLQNPWMTLAVVSFIVGLGTALFLYLTFDSAWYVGRAGEKKPSRPDYLFWGAALFIAFLYFWSRKAAVSISK